MEVRRMLLWGQFSEFLSLGYPLEEVGVIAMAIRSAIVYLAALFFVRMASLRLLAKASAFDVIVAIMLGSIFSRAINGSAPLIPSLAAGAVLLILQRILAFIAVHTRWMGAIVKGPPVMLIRDGKIQKRRLREADLSYEDLREALRLAINDEDPSKVRRAYIERNGKVSVIPFPAEPKVVTVDVEEGVKTVRIEL